MRVLWPARTSNQSILKKIYPEYSLEGLILKLNLQYLGRLMGRGADSLVRTEGQRRRGHQRMRCLDCITDSMDINVSKLQEIVEGRGARDAAVHGATKSQTRLRN